MLTIDFTNLEIAVDNRTRRLFSLFPIHTPSGAPRALFRYSENPSIPTIWNSFPQPEVRIGRMPNYDHLAIPFKVESIPMFFMNFHAPFTGVIVEGTWHWKEMWDVSKDETPLLLPVGFNQDRSGDLRQSFLVQPELLKAFTGLTLLKALHYPLLTHFIPSLLKAEFYLQPPTEVEQAVQIFLLRKPAHLVAGAAGCWSALQGKEDHDVLPHNYAVLELMGKAPEAHLIMVQLLLFASALVEMHEKTQPHA